MTLEQIVDSVRQPQHWIIYDGKERIFIGWSWDLKDDKLEPKHGELYEKHKHREVDDFAFHIDISHKQWKEKGLMQPLMPEDTPQYSFADLQQTIYYEVHLKGKEKE